MFEHVVRHLQVVCINIHIYTPAIAICIPMPGPWDTMCGIEFCGLSQLRGQDGGKSCVKCSVNTQEIQLIRGRKHFLRSR